jgi:hypothetical protein
VGEELQGTVTGAKPLLRTTFPDRLRRGGPYREFDITVRNPSATTFHKVRLHLALDAYAPAPNEAFLVAKDVRLEKRVGRAWQRIALNNGRCDSGVNATISGPFDLGPSASQKLHLRIRLADSTPAALRSGDYFVNMSSPDLAKGSSIRGHFLIEPRRQSGGSGQPSSPPPTKPSTPAAPGSHTQPAAPGSWTAEAPRKLAHTGVPLLPLAGGLLLILGGLGLLAVARLRRPTDRRLTRPGD